MMELIKSQVVFKEETHQYFLDDKELNGITSTLIRRAYPDKYKDIDPSVLANAAAKGHRLHELIEYHDNFGTSSEEHEDERVQHYEEIKQTYGLTTVANEYLVSDEEHYASSIDIVMTNELDEICLVDIKTTWNLDRESVALQLSIYKRFFERQNPTLKVAHLYALWLPNKDYTISQLNEVREVSSDVIVSLIAADLADQPFDITATYGTLPAQLADVENEIIRIDQQLKQWKERQEELKQGLYDLMEQHDIKSFTGSKVKLTRVLPTTSESLDSKKLKEEHPDIYKSYIKTTQRAGSLKITYNI